jgi:hypothetical protein
LFALPVLLLADPRRLPWSNLLDLLLHSQRVMSLSLQDDSAGAIHPTILNEAKPDPQDLSCRLRLETSPSVQREQQHIAENLAVPVDAERCPRDHGRKVKRAVADRVLQQRHGPLRVLRHEITSPVNGQTWKSRNRYHSDQTVGLLNHSLLPLKIASVTSPPAHSPEDPPILLANALGQTQ